MLRKNLDVVSPCSRFQAVPVESKTRVDLHTCKCDKGFQLTTACQKPPGTRKFNHQDPDLQSPGCRCQGELNMTDDEHEVLPVRPEPFQRYHQSAFRDALEPVRESARKALLDFNLSTHDVSTANSLMCKSCRRVVRLRWTTCEGKDCGDPCNRWRNYFFGVNKFCPVMRDVLHAHGTVVDEHLKMMWNIKKSKDAYEETCNDLHMCGTIQSVLVEAKIPAASGLRDNLAGVLAEGTNFGKDALNAEDMCQECQRHTNAVLSDAECQIKSFGQVSSYCAPSGSCVVKQKRWGVWVSECGLSDQIAEQRVTPLPDLRKVPIDQRHVSLLIAEAAGSAVVPWLHDWAVNSSDWDACEWIGLCGDGPGAIIKQIEFEENIYSQMQELTTFFRDKYPEMKLLPNLRASWTAIKQTSTMAQALFDMRHSISPGLERNLKNKTSEMMNAMFDSGFLDSVPTFVQPVLASAINSFSQGNPFGPRHLLEVVAKAFAVSWVEGSSHKDAKEEFKTMVLTMQGYEDSEASDETEDDDFLSVEDMLENPLSEMSEADASTEAGESLMQTGAQNVQRTEDATAGLAEPTSAIAIAQSGYAAVFSTCAGLAVYAQQEDYVVYCAAWPVVVARLVPAVIEGVKAIQNWRGTMKLLGNRTREFMRTDEFRAVLLEAAGQLLQGALAGNVREALVDGSGTIAKQTLELIDFGTLNSTFRHPKVKKAVTESVQDLVREARLDLASLINVVPMLLTRSTTNIGRAIFEVAVNESAPIKATSDLFNSAIERATTENRSTSQIALDMLGDPASPMLQLLGSTSAKVMQIFLPGVDLETVEWLEVLRRPEVESELKKSITNMEPPLSATRIASELTGNPELRELLVRAVLQEMAPGIENGIGSNASDPGMEALVSLSLAHS